MMRGRRFWRETRAAAALIFAVTAVPLIGFLGLALDVGMVTMVKARLALAADSAALKAITVAAAAYAADPNSAYMATGEAAGLAFFNAQLGTMAFGTATAPSVSITANLRVVTATVTAQALVPALFASVLGMGGFTVNQTSATSMTNPAYVAIQILVDTSPSMGLLVDTVNDPATLLAKIKTQIGTTAPVGGSMLVASSVYDGIATVSGYNITPKAYPSGLCAFACHNDNSTSGPGGYSNDYYGVAKANGLQLRIDVLRTAVSDIIQQVQASYNASYFQFGLYGFATNLSTIFPLGADLSAAYTASQAIAVTPTQAYCTAGSRPPPFCNSATVPGGYGSGFRTGAIPETSFEVGARSLIGSTLTPAPSIDGSTPSTAFRYLFLITDGVDDYTTTVVRNSSCCNQFVYKFNKTNGVNGGSVGATNPCDEFKAAGVVILVLYTPYTPLPGVWTYDNLVKPYVEPTANSQVTAALQACASAPENFFLANSPSEIKAAMNQMLAIASAKVGRFTQ